MNFINKIILLIILVSGFNVLYTQDDNANLIIKTNSDDAGLFFDEKFIGKGNIFQIDAEPGIHSIYLVEDLNKWDAEIIKDTISVEILGENVFSYNFKTKTLLNTIPEDVYVYEQDSLVGFTPVLIETGFDILKLEKPDYTSLNVTSKEISNGQKPELNYIGEPPKTQFYGSTLFTVLLGTAIALGAATAYYKLEADKLYEEYKITGDPGLVDNIDHYDGQSAGTFIAMEICVGALIYFFLTY